MKRFYLLIIFILFLVVPIYAFQIYPLQIDQKGLVTFTVEVEASKVAIAGNFNEWNKDKHLMQKDEMGLYSVSINLSEGDYEYKIVIDDKNWLPQDNIKFKVKKIKDQFSIEGGESVSRLIEKKNNLKINKKVYLKGLYKAIFINKVYKNNSNMKVDNEDHRHILDLETEVFANDNVFASFVIGIDTSKANYLNFWQGQLNFYTSDTALLLYNHKKSIEFKDPLHSFDNWFYQGSYPLFNFPILFYDSKAYADRLGINTRGLIFQYHTFVDFYVFFSRYNYKNDTLIGIKIKRDLKRSFIAFNSINRRFKYEENQYINPVDSDWFQSYENSDVYYQIDRSLLYNKGDASYVTKNGIEMNIGIGHYLKLFSEYLYKKKEGGFFAKVLLSNGLDLPLNYENYSSSGYNYAKNIYYYELPYSGHELIIGGQLFFHRKFQQELSYAYDTVEFNQIDTFDVTDIKPQQNIVHSVTKTSFLINGYPVDLLNKIKLIIADKDVPGYSYQIYFDKDNFYNKQLKETYMKILLKSSLSSQFLKWIFFNYHIRYNKYYQRDIYFASDNKWTSETTENIVNLVCHLSQHWHLTTCARLKTYSLGQYMEKDIFKRFDKLYINPFVQLKYRIYKNLSVALEYGLNPESDELHRDGLVYYLYNHQDSDFPFFANAEDNLMNQSFISLRGDLRF